MTEAPFDLPQAHHWFAVEFNNRAWDLVEAARRSPAETEQMLHMAHAAAVHWLKIGTIVNQVRAQYLLATAYATAHLGAAATRHADQCLQLCRQAGDEPTPFDRASAYGSAANAYACAGDLVRAGEYFRQAALAAADFDHPEERQVFERLYLAPVSPKN